MIKVNDRLPVCNGYAAWLADTIKAQREKSYLVDVFFSSDNTAVSFNKISYATYKVLSEQDSSQE